MKLDFANAFNTIRRDTILERREKNNPELYKFVLATHFCEAKLTFGPYIILSREGSQPGNPLSGLELCDTVHPILAEYQSKLTLGYMDDFKLGGRIEAVASDVQRIIDAEKKIGLRLNATKCEIIAKNLVVIKNYQMFKNFKKVTREDLTILGSPILKGPQ